MPKGESEIRIPASVIEAAAMANCPDVATWEAQQHSREADARVILQAALSAWGATVEERNKTEYPESERRKAQGGRVEVHPRVIERRIATCWREADHAE